MYSNNNSSINSSSSSSSGTNKDIQRPSPTQQRLNNSNKINSNSNSNSNNKNKMSIYDDEVWGDPYSKTSTLETTMNNVAAGGSTSDLTNTSSSNNMAPSMSMSPANLFTFVNPAFSLDSLKQTALTEPYPVSRTKKAVIGSLLILTPVIIYIVAITSFGAAFNYPFFLIVAPSLLVFLPTLAMAYKKRGALPGVRAKKVVILVSFVFALFTFFVPVYLACILSPLYNMKTVQNETSEYYHPSSWLLALPIAYLHICVFIQLVSLSQCTLRGHIFRWVITYPASVFFTGVLLSVPFMFIAPLLPAVMSMILMLICLTVACTGLYYTTLTRQPNKWSVKDIMVRKTLDDEDDQLLSRRRVQRVGHSSPTDQEVVDYKQPLSIIQIADPHLGPIMSVERLEEICEHTVKLNPDLVFLTGDFFTAEVLPLNSLARALAPLKKLSGKTFACLGNHDYEEGCLEILTKALQSIGCPLLVDQCVLAETRIGKVQILGFDYRSKARQEHIQRVCDAHPPIANVPRIGLLHDPGAFKFIPADYGLMVFSGHTHGGQIGLTCFGINLTVVGLVTGSPDHSLWQQGYNYLYVHTGQGCRSLMGAMILRVGVPTEDSLLQIYFEN
ncbi:hypothetical protein SAMD00019534_072650 [Acytostelium subglobosum LB1]|uniref:hypothetical protein n=1 Tax=Acytostelium subglobosum LB1 TaxID=1410327 RepID=UPI000644F2BE|nr:hypothetical protein SAMD00019534_072650 [Acytostelium subglobosum LB1]GAM24090.1 hypothetical protein SAMD00019534_072650 [Acytostelium subglobosum LB1]|eukprot:XP_012753126.1 hypothetical protein SAMD00019534_072650 [Acytostelium subglobosum LB1]